MISISDAETQARLVGNLRDALLNAAAAGRDLRCATYGPRLYALVEELDREEEAWEVIARIIRQETAEPALPDDDGIPF